MGGGGGGGEVGDVRSVAIAMEKNLLCRIPDFLFSVQTHDETSVCRLMTNPQCADS